MIFDPEFFVVMTEQPVGKARKHVLDCVTEGKCLCCEEKKDNIRRGLCVRCYSIWVSRKKGMGKRAAASYEVSLIRRGLLLEAQGCRAIRSSSKLDRVAKELGN